ncbi:MAG: YlxM family DNA-binding protein [Oscillospiraceae bacterium]|nr:YlxM family DNA-binding protein [Oscillospiraceae bacterium]
MKNQAYHMSMLFDFYGDLLTERQREFFDLYYNEDYSLAEIAENSGITRQGVRDAIIRAEGVLTEMEEKTGIIQRFLQFWPHVSAIESAAKEILLVNRRTQDNSRISALAEQILASAAFLKE